MGTPLEPAQNPAAETELSKAVKLLAKSLKEDPGYFESWQANIAVQFQDEWAKYFSEADENKKIIGVISNQAAENFLNLLIAQP